MLYVFHGEDELSRSEAIAELRGKMDPVTGELNTAILDGRSLSLGELQAACDAMPFLADRRLIIVHDLLSPPSGGKGSRRSRKAPADDSRLGGLEEYLRRLPETARLVLDESRGLPASHWVLRLAGETEGFARSFALPEGPELERWVARRAQAKGVGIAGDAAALMVTYIGPNLRLLDQELEKLATYLGGSGTIGRAEVERMVSSLQEADIFDMVDSLGSRDGRRALTLLRRLLDDGRAPLYLLTMIVRQFRLLLQAQQLSARGASQAEMAREMETAPFVVRKCVRQASNFRPEDLRAILAQLLEIDVGIKTGRVDGPLALDLFVARWAGR